MVDDGDVFHPLRWTAAEAYQFLQDVPRLESGRGHRPVARRMAERAPVATAGDRDHRHEVRRRGSASRRSSISRCRVTLDGAPLTQEEIADLLAGADGLRLLRGQWVEVRRETPAAHDRRVRPDRPAGRRTRHHVRAGDAARRGRAGRWRTGPGRGRARVGAGRARPVVARRAGWSARARRPRANRDRRPRARHAAPLSGDGRALAPAAVVARPWRLPRR